MIDLISKIYIERKMENVRELTVKGIKFLYTTMNLRAYIYKRRIIYLENKEYINKSSLLLVISNIKFEVTLNFFSSESNIN